MVTALPVCPSVSPPPFIAVALIPPVTHIPDVITAAKNAKGQPPIAESTIDDNNETLIAAVWCVLFQNSSETTASTQLQDDHPPFIQPEDPQASAPGDIDDLTLHSPGST